MHWIKTTKKEGGPEHLVLNKGPESSTTQLQITPISQAGAHPLLCPKEKPREGLHNRLQPQNKEDFYVENAAMEDE